MSWEQEKLDCPLLRQVVKLVFDAFLVLISTLGKSNY